MIRTKTPAFTGFERVVDAEKEQAARVSKHAPFCIQDTAIRVDGTLRHSQSKSVSGVLSGEDFSKVSSPCGKAGVPGPSDSTIN